MWIFSTLGFFSCVKKADGFQVRARCRSHLEALKERFKFKARIVETKNADYGHRIFVPQHQFAEAMAELIGGIDYDNFKSEVARVSDDWEYERSLHLVWQTMHDLQHDLR